MLTMLFFASRVDKNIVDEENHEFIQEWAADSIHEVHKYSGGIC